MSVPRLLVMPLVGLLAAVLLAACAASVAPIPTTESSEVPAPVTGSDAPGTDAERDAYSAAMCPVFTGILELDPRLAAMREAGAGGGDVSGHAAEMDAINAELLRLLTELEAVPEWSPGVDLRHQLIGALHGIRARLLRVADDPGAGTAADGLAALPFIASDAMDLAIQDAVQAGLTCAEGE